MKTLRYLTNAMFRLSLVFVLFSASIYAESRH